MSSLPPTQDPTESTYPDDGYVPVKEKSLLSELKELVNESKEIRINGVSKYLEHGTD